MPLFRCFPFQRCVVVASVCGALAGCGVLPTDTRIDYRSAAKAEEKHRLELPPDLTAPTYENTYNVGEQKGATYASSLQKGREGAQQGAQAVLPTLPEARIERAGTQRWLVINKPVEAVWSPIRDFWQENGFILKIDNTATGILETDWAENRARLPQDALRRTLGRLLEGLYSTPERDKYRVRVERGSTPNTTEIYITHRGMYEIYTNETKSETRWQPRPTDPELEAEMLSRLMVYLGIQHEKAQVLARQNPTSRDLAGWAEGAAQPTLVLHDPFDRAWRRAGLALDRVGLTVTDRDRAAGLYQVRAVEKEVGVKEEPGFWSRLFGKGSAESQAAEKKGWMVQVKQGGGEASTYLTLLNADGQPTDATLSRKVLGALLEQLK